MSTGTQTRGQLAARYDRVKKRVDAVKFPDGISKTLVDVANMTLEMFPITTATASAVSSVPSADEVEDFMKSLLPSPSEVFTDAFFRSPLFAVVTLHEVAKLYGYQGPQPLMTESLGLPADDVNNKNIEVHVWFSDFLSCDRETVLAVVESYKAHRGSADMLRRISLSGRRGDALPDQDYKPSPSGNEVRKSLPDDAGEGNNDLTTNINTNRLSERGPGPENMDYSPTTESPLVDSNDSRKAANVFQYFKDNKFTGDISQSIELVIRDYNFCARQHKLNPKQKADFCVNVLADPARTFFFNHARDDMTFNEMVNMMLKEYDSDARQLQVQGMLETLRLRKYMAEHDISSHSEGLSKLVDLIERLSPQCQPQFRSDANKINYLRKAVLGYNWSMVPIGNINTSKYTFNGFVTALREHLQLESEVTLANPSSSVPPEGTFHQQYGRNPKYVRKHGQLDNRSKKNHQSRISSSSFEESRRKGICHMCKQKWRPGHRCKPGYVHDYVRDRFKRGESAVHVLSDLVLGLEGEANADTDYDSPSPSDDDHRDAQDVRYGEAQDDLSVYDRLTSIEVPNSTGFMEASDKEWFTNHLSAAFSENESNIPLDSPQDF